MFRLFLCIHLQLGFGGKNVGQERGWTEDEHIIIKIYHHIWKSWRLGPHSFRGTHRDVKFLRRETFLQGLLQSCLVDKEGNIPSRAFTELSSG
jgi:hypothetical protein